jgi:carbonic anhydrase/acetyltransferase-like protein (isoleucine patch superfamily)
MRAGASHNTVTKAFRSFWYACARCADELIAGICSAMVSIWLAAATGHGSRGIRCDGFPKIRLHPRGSLTIGKGVRMISTYGLNAVGGHAPDTLWIGPDAGLSIGNRSGLSHATIVCLGKIDIGSDVLIGGGVRIFDSDFHALPSATGFTRPIATLPVTIEDNAFIGAHATILKGVTIGRGAVVGAASVVTANVPPYEVWAGNPARRISATIMARAASL